MKKILFLLILLLSFPLALASTVTVDKETYTLNEPVTIDVIGCLGSSFLTILNPSGQAVFSDQGNDDWQTVYHTSSDPNSGTYIINVYCGAELFSTTFDVGVITIEEAEEEEEVEEEVPAPSPGDGGRPSRPCTPEWSCSYWSVCGIELTQTRTCYDQKCAQPPKTESRACQACDESWVCSLWSKCIAGKQTRKCYDEHHCGTNVKKPVLQRVCNAPVTGPAPAKIIQVPPEQFPPKVEIPKPSFWDKYKLWIIIVPSILILLLAALFIYLRFYRPKKAETTNINELKAWVKKELEKGAAKEKLRAVIHRHTKWTDQEINRVFAELGK